MKKITLIILASLLSITFLNASSCYDDGKIWSERIFTGNYFSAIFTCKVLEFSSENQIETTAGIMGLRAVVQVDKVFFGKVDSIVNLNAGFYMKVGKTYLIYGRGYKNIFSFDGYCAVHSMEIPENNDRVRDIEILTELSNIINNKQTCSYTMLAHNNKKLAEGFYKNGKPTGIWKHYLWNGNIKSEYNFEENSEIQYDDNGLKKSKSLMSEQETIYYYYEYSTKNNNFLTQKHILKNTDYGHLITAFFYYDNGNIEKQYTTKSLGNKWGYGGGVYDGYYMDYQEYYENGNIKAKGNLYKEDSVGTWYFYDEKGINTSKKVYEDLDTDKFLAAEKEQIEKNKPYKLEKSSMYGKVSDKNTGKGLEGVLIGLFRDGSLYFTEFTQTWDDGSYSIESIPIGNYEVKAEYYGGSFGRVKKAITYGTVKQEIEIKKDEELEFNLQLEAIGSVAE